MIKVNLNKYYYLNLRLERYGISPMEFLHMLEKQKGKCAICKRNIENGWIIEHDHDTGRIRGLTCQSCNNLISRIERGQNLSAENEIKYGNRIRKYLKSWDKEQMTLFKYFDLNYYDYIIPQFNNIDPDVEKDYMNGIR